MAKLYHEWYLSIERTVFLEVNELTNWKGIVVGFRKNKSTERGAFVFACFTNLCGGNRDRISDRLSFEIALNAVSTKLLSNHFGLFGER